MKAYQLGRTGSVILKKLRTINCLDGCAEEWSVEESAGKTNIIFWRNQSKAWLAIPCKSLESVEPIAKMMSVL